MTSTKNPYLEAAEKLAAAGYAAESIRVRALASYRAKPGEIPPLARALLPDAATEEAIAIDMAVQVSTIVEGLARNPHTGDLHIATIVFALAMTLRRFEKLAAASTVADGAQMGEAFAIEIVEKARAYQDRIATLSDIMLGKADNAIRLTDDKGNPL